jgi:integrase
MDKLTDEERLILAKGERVRELARKRQRVYMERVKRRNPDYKDEHAAYMREYNAENRAKLVRVQDKIGFVPPRAEIPNIEPPNVDKRTKKGKQALRAFQIQPSFANRKFALESNTIDTYVKNITKNHKRFGDKKSLPENIKNKVRTLLNGSDSIKSSPEIEGEMPYLSTKNIDDFIREMRTLYPNDNTYKTNLTPFTSLTSHIENLRDSYQKLTRISKEINEIVEEKRKLNVVDEQDEGKIIDLSDRDELIANMLELKNLRDRIIYGLYTLMPARRLETRLLKITREKNVKNLTSLDDNYVIVSKPMKVVYNNYKTYKEYGQQVFEVPKELAEVIETYINVYKLQDGHYIFYKERRGANERGKEEVAQANYSNKVIAVFKKVYNIKGISVRFLRQSWATSLTEKSYAEREKVATAMGHSLLQNLKYAKQQNKQEIDFTNVE